MFIHRGNRFQSFLWWETAKRSGDGLIREGTAPNLLLVGGSRSEPGEGLIREGTAPLSGGMAPYRGGACDSRRRRVGKGGTAPYLSQARSHARHLSIRDPYSSLLSRPYRQPHGTGV